MRLTLALFAMAALLPEGVAAQSASDRAALDSVDRYVRAELERQRIPGMSVAVLRDDSILLARGYGFANLEHRVPATDSTIYQSGSVGKQFTSAAIVTLAREGKLGLDDPIRKYLPEAPSGWAKITVRHLLTHTSGVPDYTADLVDFRRDYTEEALAKLYAGLRLDFSPGRPGATATPATPCSDSSCGGSPAGSMAITSRSGCSSRWGCARHG